MKHSKGPVINYRDGATKWEGSQGLPTQEVGGGGEISGFYMGSLKSLSFSHPVGRRKNLFILLKGGHERFYPVSNATGANVLGLCFVFRSTSSPKINDQSQMLQVK